MHHPGPRRQQTHTAEEHKKLPREADHRIFYRNSDREWPFSGGHGLN